jgi:hypothetical protein
MQAAVPEAQTPGEEPEAFGSGGIRADAPGEIQGADPVDIGQGQPKPAGPGFQEAPLEAGGMAGDPHRAVPEGLQHSRQNLSTGMAGAKSLALGDAMGGQGSR